MKSWYLIRIFYSSWLLGITIWAFIGGEIFFNIKRIQNFPFFIYDMYSHPQQIQSVYKVYTIYVNGKVYDYSLLGDYQEGILLNTIKQYEMAVHSKMLQPALYQKFQHIQSKTLEDRITKQCFADFTALAYYPSWLFHTLQKLNNDTILSYRIESTSVSYQNSWIKNPVEINVLSYHEK
jgi:hypothetical protein